MRSILILILSFFTLISGGVPSLAQSTCGDNYRVQVGDTLTSIARRCNTTAEELIRLNPGSESVIQSGALLRLPNYTVAQQPPALTVNPLSGAPGTPLTIAANGFPAYTEVELRIGSRTRGTDQIDRAITTANGVLRAELQIPPTAQVGETYVVIVETLDGLTNARSYGINVTFSSGRLFDETTIYLIALGDAGENGIGFGCRDSLVPVSVPIAPTVAPLTAGLETLLASSTRSFPGTTYYNALNQSDLRLERVAVINRVAEIALVGNLVVGGTCDTPRIQAQLEQIARQYNTVDAVQITVNGVPLSEVLGIATPTPQPTTTPTP